jgi:hypothetical protein
MRSRVGSDRQLWRAVVMAPLNDKTDVEMPYDDNAQWRESGLLMNGSRGRLRSTMSD